MPHRIAARSVVKDRAFHCCPSGENGLQKAVVKMHKKPVSKLCITEKRKLCVDNYIIKYYDYYI